jgi:hypothetical protein
VGSDFVLYCYDLTWHFAHRRMIAARIAGGAVNSFVVHYIHGRKGEVLFSISVSDTTRDKKIYMSNFLRQCFFRH